jgi:ABC-type nickel/cobalt efflux system permease component RcnA
MEHYTLLLLGCMVGMQHALEADHLAAVAALASKRDSRRALVLRGSAWGLGHSLTLLCFAGALLLLGKSISPRAEAALELAVGVMIVGLGLNVLYKVWRRRPHVHVHRHGPGKVHIHVHSHAGESVPHEQSSHAHAHESLGLKRAVLVGMLHGAAGSAALLVLAAAAAESILQVLGYVAAFGIGSTAGMAALSFVASYPLRLIERYARWLHRIAFAGIGCAAIVIGGRLVGTSWGAL